MLHLGEEHRSKPYAVYPFNFQQVAEAAFTPEQHVTRQHPRNMLPGNMLTWCKRGLMVSVAMSGESICEL